MYACIYMRVCVYTHVTTIVTLFLTRTRLRSKHRIKPSLFAFHRYPASLSSTPLASKPLSRSAPGALTVEQLTRRYFKHLPASAVIDNSQTRYLFQHVNAYAIFSPEFITILGATTFDIKKELSNIPRSVTTLIFHVGTSELERYSCEETLR